MKEGWKEAKKAEYRRLYNAVREVLFHEWDPIGVNSHATDDEYDSYAPSLCSLLMQGADAVKIAARLDDWSRNAMGLSNVDPEHSRRIAHRLLSLAEPTDGGRKDQ